MPEELTRARDTLDPLLARQYRNRAGRGELLEALIDRELLVLEARTRGIDQRPAVRAQVLAYEQRLIAKALAKEIKLQAPDEARLRAWYRKHPADFTEPEQFEAVRVRFAKGQAKAARAAFDGRASLGNMRRAGLDAQRVRLTARDVPTAVWVALHKAWEGPKVTEELTVGDERWLVRVVKYRARILRPFESVKSEIAARLRPAQRRLAIDALVKSLRQKHAVEVRRELVD